ncbi:hypothetical protein ACFVS2_26575 [Brevibacillus sp. NPDC058079]|uniref:hypothetical protein n=1 Tax=Brevibacillus sp. NPDC058079 TaxID=3346330 RepID=UPI0036ECBF54
MWTKEEIMISLQNNEIPKWKIAEYLPLEKSWNRYKREEFAELAAKETQTNVELSQMLHDGRKQYNAKKELWDLYFKDRNTAPPMISKNEWVTRLQEYKNSQ